MLWIWRFKKIKYRCLFKGKKRRSTYWNSYYIPVYKVLIFSIHSIIYQYFAMVTTVSTRDVVLTNLRIRVLSRHWAISHADIVKSMTIYSSSQYHWKSKGTFYCRWHVIHLVKIDCNLFWSLEIKSIRTYRRYDLHVWPWHQTAGLKMWLGLWQETIKSDILTYQQKKS